MAGAAYVIFDGDNDKWAYAYMNGWKNNKKIDFHYENAHELDSMTGRAQNEQYVKSRLRQRMEKSTAVVVIIGEKTKSLYKYVRWELELALEMGLPIIAANINKKNGQDDIRCPAIIRNNGNVVHIQYTLEAIKHAMYYWPSEHRRMTVAERSNGWRYYEKFDAI
ncbi:TIR domain-containing protein [Phreatobacter oligotrophus]|uniref:TIR domain-containing protein n=1 Tax=Phreatobacter oligotrophus TaxID=1122261 RepID=UPI0023523167|nr:TIR domain-containing protein [Phreatobacter oligotrophus]MBX9991578.1 TIR domain-containing protein [Phreatobacter oligotrophus]